MLMFVCAYTHTHTSFIHTHTHKHHSYTHTTTPSPQHTYLFIILYWHSSKSYTDTSPSALATATSAPTRSNLITLITHLLRTVLVWSAMLANWIELLLLDVFVCVLDEALGVCAHTWEVSKDTHCGSLLRGTLCFKLTTY
jgi:hypothetical protein